MLKFCCIIISINFSDFEMLFFSHLHRNMPIRFLTCEPNLQHRINYTDEADAFYSDPPAWIAAHTAALRRQRNIAGFDGSNEILKSRTPEFNSPELTDAVTSSELQEMEAASGRYQYAVHDPLKQFPTHVIMFDELVARVRLFLKLHEYKLCIKVYHSPIMDGRRSHYINVYCLPAK